MMQTGRKLLLGACGTNCPLREGEAARVDTRAWSSSEAEPGLALAANHSSEALSVPSARERANTAIGKAVDGRRRCWRTFLTGLASPEPWELSWATAKAWPEPPASTRPPPAAPTHVWGNKGEAVLLQLWKISHKMPIAWSELLVFLKKDGV